MHVERNDICVCGSYMQSGGVELNFLNLTKFSLSKVRYAAHPYIKCVRYKENSLYIPSTYIPTQLQNSFQLNLRLSALTQLYIALSCLIVCLFCFILKVYRYICAWISATVCKSYKVVYNSKIPALQQAGIQSQTKLRL